VESRRQRPATSPRVKKKAQVKAEGAVGVLSLPNIAQLIEDGEITIGMLRPVGCVATAADEDCNYAMLVRRRGETLFQLLTRLDQAIDKALTLGIFTDEINH
jgi:acetylglutamate kinase